MDMLFRKISIQSKTAAEKSYSTKMLHYMLCLHEKGCISNKFKNYIEYKYQFIEGLTFYLEYFCLGK